MAEITSNQQGDTPVICDILRQLHDRQLLTVTQMADLLNILPANVYPYHHDRELRYSQFRTLFRRCGSAEAQRELLRDLLEGTRWHALFRAPGSGGDVNGDGDINLLDAIQRAVDAEVGHACMLRSLVDTDGARPCIRTITAEQRQSIVDAGLQAIEAILDAIDIVDHMHKHTTPRRQARPLTVGAPGSTNGRND